LDKHRRSVRLPDYDYSSPGAYFVTICTAKRKSIFGEIIENELKINEMGNIAYNCWLNITDHFLNTELDEFIIMPNHIHGIIMIKPRRGMASTCPSQENTPDPRRGMASTCPSGLPVSNPYERKFGKPQTGSLGIIIANFKSIVTKRIWELTASKTPIWQRNFYEHIIRSERDLNAIREYIRDNQAKWEKDEYHF
jgi:REP element-mobilizing transposase RayT